MGEHSGDMPDVDVPSLRSRQPGAIERWFLDHVDAIYTFAFHRVGKDHDLATDVVQETFVMALEHIEQYESERGSMFAWLTGIAMNCIRQVLRQRGRGEIHSGAWEQIDERLLAAYRDLAAVPLPEDVVVREETAERVRMTLSSIPGNYRDVLKRHYHDEQSLIDIARRHGVTEGAVKSLLHRARLAFKTAFVALTESSHGQRSAKEQVR